MFKKYYREFLKAHEGKIHLNAHSHHFWPDITKEAQLQSWQDSALYSDDKWNFAFSELIPNAQRHIAKILNYSNPSQIAFAPNTHELLSRLFSSFQDKKKTTLLTTTSEFHSLGRQAQRLMELESFDVISIDNEKESFKDDFLEQIKNADIIFISQVFFNSGEVLEKEFIEKIIREKNKETIFCLDGYHAFCAIPTDLSSIEEHVYYFAGGYKYAQAGEGACFMTVPKNCSLRPVNTGWFASFETLEEHTDKVLYSKNGMKFWGATQDLTPWYRFNAVWDLFTKDGLTVSSIDQFIKKKQQLFIDNIEHRDLFLSHDIDHLGHFLTIEFADQAVCKKVQQDLAKKNILTDFRGSRLRFGFGMYLDDQDVLEAARVVNSLKSIN